MTPEEERAAVVRWLRMVAEGMVAAMQATDWRKEKLIELEAGADAYSCAADAIESGVHLSYGEPG